MWSPVLFVLIVASVRADADADADAEPFLPYVYPQPSYGNDWAAMHFGTPQETLETKQSYPEEHAAYRPSFGFLPGVVAPSPIVAIRDAQAPTASILQLQKPVETHDVQVLRRPTLVFAPPPPPLFFQTTHIRVPGHNQIEPVPVPASTAPSSPSFGSQHTAQVFFRPPSIASLLRPASFAFPISAPSIDIQHSAQVPVFPPSFSQKVELEDEDDDDDDDEVKVNYILVPHFPSEIASLTSLRVRDDDEPVIPAGIVQSTQPSFRPMMFTNSKVHPDLLGRLHETSGSSVDIE